MHQVRKPTKYIGFKPFCVGLAPNYKLFDKGPVKTQKWSKMRIFKSWDRKYVQNPPRFWEGQNLSNQKLWHTVRVTSKQIIDPTNIITSDQQSWLIALIWCKIGFFDILSFIVKLLYLFRL